MSTQGLTEDDIKVLLSNVNPPEAAMGRLSQHFAEQTLTSAERLAVEDVMRAMLQGAAVKVRQVLADTLKDSDLLPHDIAMDLASDVESVDLPILTFSSE